MCCLMAGVPVALVCLQLFNLKNCDVSMPLPVQQAY